MNSYLSLFFIAFEEQDFNKLATNLASIMILKQISINIFEFCIPWILVKIKKRKFKKTGMLKKEDQKKIEE